MGSSKADYITMANPGRDRETGQVNLRPHPYRHDARAEALRLLHPREDRWPDAVLIWRPSFKHKNMMNLRRRPSFTLDTDRGSMGLCDGSPGGCCSLMPRPRSNGGSLCDRRHPARAAVRRRGRTGLGSFPPAAAPLCGRNVSPFAGRRSPGPPDLTSKLPTRLEAVHVRNEDVPTVIKWRRRGWGPGSGSVGEPPPYSPVHRRPQQRGEHSTARTAHTLRGYKPAKRRFEARGRTMTVTRFAPATSESLRRYSANLWPSSKRSLRA